jgi:hypothetical protein
MRAQLVLPEGDHDFESYGYILGIDGEDMQLTLTDETKARTVRLLFSREELVELIRPLISGHVIEIAEIA